MPPIQTDLISGKEVLLHPPSSGGSAPPGSLPEVGPSDDGKVLAVVDGAWDKADMPSLADIVTLTGASGDVSPGGYYELTTSSAFTLGIEGAAEGKVGFAIIDIVLGTGGSVTGGTGLEIKSELKTGKLNRCFVVFKNSSAELWAWADGAVVLASPPTTSTVGSVGQLAVWHDAEATDQSKADHEYHLLYIVESAGGKEYIWREDVTGNQGNVVGGYPVLDENGKVASAQLPPFSNAPEPIIGTTAPTTSTVGAVGQLYVDTATSKTYHCTAVTNTGTEAEPVYSYTWTDDINEKGGTFKGAINIDKGAINIDYDYYKTVFTNRAGIIGYENTKDGYGTLMLGAHNVGVNAWYALYVGSHLGSNNDVSHGILTGQYNVRSENCFLMVGNGTSSMRHNALEFKRNGDMYVYGQYTQHITDIPPATTEYTLALGAQQHTPLEATTYILPLVNRCIQTYNCKFFRAASLDGTGYYGWTFGSDKRYTNTPTPTTSDFTWSNPALNAGKLAVQEIDNRTHECILTIKFSSTVLTYEFQDSAGNTLVPLPLNGDIEAGSVVTFLCRYNPLLAQWVIYPVMDGKEVTP